MPSKLRIVLQLPDGTIRHGRNARKMVHKNVSVWQLPFLPEGWQALPMRDKLAYLAKYLPHGFELSLIQERKHTRKNKSLYVKMIQGNRPAARLIGNKYRVAFDYEVLPLAVPAPAQAPAPPQNAPLQQAFDPGVLNQLLNAVPYVDQPPAQAPPAAAGVQYFVDRERQRIRQRLQQRVARRRANPAPEEEQP